MDQINHMNHSWWVNSSIHCCLKYFHYKASPIFYLFQMYHTNDMSAALEFIYCHFLCPIQPNEIISVSIKFFEIQCHAFIIFLFYRTVRTIFDKPKTTDRQPWNRPSPVF